MKKFLPYLPRTITILILVIGVWSLVIAPSFAASELGTITPPGGVPVPTSTDPSEDVAKLIRAGVSLLLIASFIIFFIWTLIAGLRFVFAGGDSKNIGAAWSQIYWGLIGMVVVMGSFAIVKLVETFFNVTIFTNFQLPSGS